MQVAILGPLHVERNGSSVDMRDRAVRALFALLAVNANHVVSLDDLAEAHVSELRGLLGADAGRLTTEARGYRLALDDDELDSAEFERAVDRATTGPVDAAGASALLARALERWRGPALADFRGIEWADAEASRLDDLRATALVEWADAELGLGHPTEVAAALEKVIGDFPLHEGLHGKLMLALYRSEREGEALARYHDLEARLGRQPGADLARLGSAIARRDPSLARDATPAARLATFLFTDMVSSTEMWERAPDAAAVRVRAHLEAVDRIVRAHEGSVFKTAGDGAHAVFDRPSDAAAAAVAIQLDARAPIADEVIGVRVGIYTGEAHPVEGDWFGRPLNRCARVAALAHAGQVLLSQSTAGLLLDPPPGTAIQDRGLVTLRGVPAPERVHELVIGGAATASVRSDEPGPPPLPDELRVASPTAIAGRTAELGTLMTCLDQSTAGALHMALVVGEAGIGKTTLAALTAARAVEAGALVLYGRGDAELAAPHEPVLSALAPVIDAAPLDLRMPIDVLRSTGQTSVDSSTAELQRLQAYDALRDAVDRAAADRPLVLVVDDLQWMSRATLVMLRHLVRTASTRLLVIATVRDTADELIGDVARLVDELSRQPVTTVVRPGALSLADVQSVVAAFGGSASGSADLLDRSGGNPFFLLQLLGERTEAGATVFDAVTRRTGRLSAPARKVLATAAVVGHSFTVPVVEHAHGGDVLDALDEAIGAGLVRELPSRPGGHEFVHGLVREAILDELSAARRSRLHRRVAEAIQELDWRGTTAETVSLATSPDRRLVRADVIDPATQSGSALPAIARHYLESDGDALVTAAFCALASRQLLFMSIWDEAVDLATEGLAALDQAGTDDEHTALRIPLLMTLRNGLHNTMRNDEAAALQPEMLRLARSTGDPELLGEVVYTLTMWATLDTGAANAELCEEALAALGEDGAPQLRAQLYGALSLSLIMSPHPDGAIAASERSLELARSVGDAWLVCDALFDLANAITPRPGTVERRRALAAELLALDAGDDGSPIFAAVRTAVVAETECGERSAVDEALERVRRRTEWSRRSGIPTALLIMWQSMLALADGRFEEAGCLLAELRERAGTESNLVQSTLIQRSTLTRERWGASRSLAALRAMAEEDWAPAVLKATRAVAALDAGELDEALQVCEELTREDLAAVPRDAMWSATLAFLAEVLRGVGSEDSRRAVMQRLEPHSGLLVVHSWGVVCLGAADRYLGGLRAALGHLDEGVELIERGIALEERFGAAALVARSRLWLAEALAARGDLRRAADEAARAHSLASSLGMERVAADARW
jgi:class 3 adenylate cyclase